MRRTWQRRVWLARRHLGVPSPARRPVWPYGGAVSAPKPRLFLGSSSEGRDVARNLQAELSADLVEVERWDQSVFEPGGYTLDSLISKARRVDFAVLVATPDDTTARRGESRASPRDNVVLEFGLFAGVLGRERTYLLATGDLRLPTDVLGLTRLPYTHRADGNLRAAVSAAALQVDERVRSLGPLPRGAAQAAAEAPRSSLEREIALLCENAVSQGWTIQTNSATTLRLRSPRGRQHTLAKAQPEATRAELRLFAAELRAGGLRMNSVLRHPADQSPL